MKKQLLLFLFLGSLLNVNSQTFTAGTIYTNYQNISPDFLLNYTVTPYTHQVYGLNIFGDSLNDIELVAHGAVSSGGSGAYIKVVSLDTNIFIRFGRLDSVFTPSTSTWNISKVAKIHTFGQQINDPAAIWDNTELYLTDHSGSGGGNKDVNDWIGGENYIGVKYQLGASSWFGWIHVECISEDSCYVKELSSAVASVGVYENFKTPISVFPNPVNACFYISAVNTAKLSNIQLTDLFGNLIPFSSRQKGDVLEIVLDHEIADGCYVLTYFSGTEKGTQKIVKVSK